MKKKTRAPLRPFLLSAFAQPASAEKDAPPAYGALRPGIIVPLRVWQCRGGEKGSCIRWGEETKPRSKSVSNPVTQSMTNPIGKPSAYTMAEPIPNRNSKVREGKAADATVPLPESFFPGAEIPTEGGSAHLDLGCGRG
jgi:hypothetical protein